MNFNEKSPKFLKRNLSFCSFGNVFFLTQKNVFIVSYQKQMLYWTKFSGNYLCHRNILSSSTQDEERVEIILSP